MYTIKQKYMCLPQAAVHAYDRLRPGIARTVHERGLRLDPRVAAVPRQKPVRLRLHLALGEHCAKRRFAI